MMCAGWIIREVWIDCVLSRTAPNITKTGAITRAVCYEVMGRATRLLAYSALPEPIRIDIDNEMGKNHRAQADRYIREYIAGQFLQKAATCWSAVDLEIKKAKMETNGKTSGSHPVIGQLNIDTNDKFYFA